MTMLDRMRRHRGWLKWSLALVVLTFVVFFIPNFTSTGAAPNDVLAEVEGHEITVREFQRRYSAQLQAYRNAYGAQMPGFAADLGHGAADFTYTMLLGADAAGALMAGIILEGRGLLRPDPSTALRLA